MAIHAARPDAIAIAHLHPPYATLFAVAKREYKPLTLHSSIFGSGVSFYVYSQPTVYERLEESRIPWRIYVGDFPQSFLMTAQWPYAGNYAPMANFVHDAAGDPKSFPAYTFIEPSFGASQNDQHPPYDVWLGEALLGTVYNALRSNAALWNTTLLVVLYDEHGGFYDHVDPKTVNPGLSIAPDEHTDGFNFRTFGVRVPALLVTPWIGRGVLHTEFDHTSLLNYAIHKWNLGPLGLRAAAANNFATALLGASRTDTPESIPVVAATPSNTPVALNRNQSGPDFIQPVLRSAPHSTIPTGHRG
jgi:phospholipase C